MKQIITIILALFLFNSCESDSPTGVGGDDPQQPAIITTVEMGLSNVESDFDTDSDAQNTFIEDLADSLNLSDSNRIQILSITLDRASATIELMFLESSNMDELSVDSLLNAILTVDSIGDYIIESIQLNESSNAQSADYILTIANTELQNILSSLYECDDYDNYYNDYINCSDEVDFTNLNDLYIQALSYNSSSPEANFGAGLTAMLSIVNDAQLEEFMNKWDDWEDEGGSGFFPSDNRSNSTIFNSKIIPAGIAGFIFPTTMNFTSYLPFNYLFDYYLNNNEEENNRDETYISEMMDLVDSSFLPKITNSINYLENAVNQNFTFEITSEMQGNEYQDPMQMDDAEMHLLMAAMHAMKYALYSVSAIDLDPGVNPNQDIEDFTILEQDSNFLKLRSGRENYFPQAHDEIIEMLTSLTAAYNFIENDTDTEYDITLWQEISQTNVETNDGIVSLEDFIKPISGGTVYDIFNSNQIVEFCNTDCSYDCNNPEYYYDEWMNQCYCWDLDIGGYYYPPLETCSDLIIDLGGFMNNPPNNLKNILPNYNIESSYDIEDFSIYSMNDSFSPTETSVVMDLSECVFDCNMSDASWEWHWSDCRTQIYRNFNPFSSHPDTTYNTIPYSNLEECNPIADFINQTFNNLDAAIDTTGYASFMDSDSDDWFHSNDLGYNGSLYVHPINQVTQDEYELNFSLFVNGYTMDEEPCLNWEAQNLVDWKNDWDITLGGLFPQMSNGDFFSTLINVNSWEDIDQECSD